MSIQEIIEEVKTDICDHYCKYTAEEGSGNNDWIIEEGSPCYGCPLNRL